MNVNPGMRALMAELENPNNELPYELYKADSSAIRFEVRLQMGTGFANFALASRDSPKKNLYLILFGPFCKFTDLTRENEDKTRMFRLPEPIYSTYKGYWLTWYNGTICLGAEGQTEPFFTYVDNKITTNRIGFVKFHTMCARRPVDWRFEGSPVDFETKTVDFEDGRLRWERMTDKLPADALIGGFENEPIYIARAYYNGSLCPGKYVPSTALAYVPWGGREHPAQHFEILCGYNVKWIKTSGNNIPENAFIAGTSEVRGEPLYIGRAMHDNNLINGKIHILYKTCYLPYKGKEVEVYSYEVLVSLAPKERPRAISHQNYSFDNDVFKYINLYVL